MPQIDRSRDQLLTDFGKATLNDRYLLPGETYQEMFARVASTYADDDDHAQRLYDYISRLWFMPSTPVLSNGGAGRGLPISCYLNSVSDSLEGIVGTWEENVWLASRGGGIGTYWGNVRGIGEPVGLNGKTSGIIPFVRVMDSLTLAISQGSLRRGSAAVYIDISHPEIEEFLEIRKPSGDFNRKALNLHHGVLVTDAFMEAVRRGDAFDLVSPKTGEKRAQVDARSLFTKLAETRLATGEPYIVFIDEVNRQMPKHQRDLGLKVSTSNLCVAPETMILTDEGYVEIADKAGQTVKVWNGEEFSPVEIVQTGINQTLITIEFSDGSAITCTPYHKFYVIDSYGASPREVRAGDLRPDDKLMKWTAPIINQTSITHDAEAYTNGFFSGDGTYGARKNPIIWLYHDKRKVAPFLLQGSHKQNDTGGNRDSMFYKPGALWPKFTVPTNGTFNQKMNWLAGLLDADSCVTQAASSSVIQLAGSNWEFLRQVQLMAHTLGCQPKIRLMHPERIASMPDGKGGVADFNCQPCWRLLFSVNDTDLLRRMGLPVHRIEIPEQTPQRDARQFVKVVEVSNDGRTDDTYCFTEPKRHLAVFNGILTGQCSEITLPTGTDHLGKERTAVCCLSSLNLETWHEWQGDERFIEDVMRFLDNVLQDYIDRAEPAMRRAAYGAMRERSVGLGVMGFHSFLQANGLAMESALAKSWNKKMFRHIKAGVDAASVKLAHERGPCPDAADAGAMERFSSKTAIAPTASISVIAGGTSACIEPIPANIYTHKTLSGSFVVRNAALEAVLTRLGRNTDEVWNSILENEGSVQHLDFLSDHDKAIFRTAFEIDQRWLLELAADRTPFIDQAQSLNLFIPANVPKWDLVMLHYRAWELKIKSLYYLRSKSVQRAGFAGGVEADNTPSAPVIAVAPRDYDECLACQ